jgi:DNA invertase Pin-like site-specific DNA recombinase
MNSSKQPIAIGYIRVSTETQATEGVSLEAQRAKIAAWCEVNGHTLAAVHVDAGLSGGRADNRDGLQAALDAVCRSGGVLVVYSLSRLARSTADTLAISNRLEKAGADLASISERIDTTSAAGKMVFRMLAVLAEFERDQIAERVTMALAHKKSKGERTGSVPFGFTLAGDGIQLIPDDAEQAVLVTIRQLRAAGESMRAIAAELNRQGVATKNGKPWVHSTIQRILERAA